MRRILVLAVTLAVVAAACGDDTSTTTEAASGAKAAVVAGLRQQISTSQAEEPGAFPMSDDEIGCFAVALVDTFGVARMTGAVDESFEGFMAGATTSERRQVIDSMFGCVDLGPALAEEIGGDDISPASARCLADAMLASDSFRDALANSLAGSSADPFQDPALIEDLLPVMLTCLTAEELMNLGS